MYPCGQCSYKAKEKGHLLTHVRSKHEGLRFPCDQCENKATQKYILLTHMRSIHEGVKFQCDQCDFKASRKAILSFFGELALQSTFFLLPFRIILGWEVAFFGELAFQN